MPTTLRTRREGRVMTLVIDNPPGNALDKHVVAELDAVTRGLQRDTSVGAVVVTAEHPRAFVSIYDVGEMLSGAEVTPRLPAPVVGGALRAVGAFARLPGGAAILRRTPAEGMLALWRLHQVYLRMARMDKAFVAAINGVAAGAGCELALACDLRLIADGDFGIGLPEPVLGFNPGGGGSQRLARIVGPGRATEMLLEGRMYAPKEALEAGLVHRVVSPERLLEEAEATAARLARRSPRVIAAVKRATYRRAWSRDLHAEAAQFGAAVVTPAVKRAMRTFVEQEKGLPPETPSVWADGQLLHAWQEGEVTDLTADGRR